MDLIEQTLLSRYRVERRLASGGMAEVYAGTDLRLGRPVAIKTLHPHLAEDPAFAARLRREVQATAALVHPSIVRTFDAGEDRGRPFLVMELVEGENLAALLRRAGPLPLEQALAIADDVLDALDHAHRRGILHRDVKPQNVLLAPDGRAKLADFGIAARTAEAAEKSGLTRTGEVLGSLHYLAPERLAGQPATPAADIYAAGVVLYQMLAGQLPFAGDVAAAIAAQHWRRAPSPPSALRPEVPDWLDQVVLAALAKDPAARFPSAVAMRQSLDRGRAGHDTATVQLATRRPDAGPALAADALPSRQPKPSLLLPLVAGIAALTLVAAMVWVARAFLSPTNETAQPSASALTAAPVATSGRAATSAPQTTVSPAATATAAASSSPAATTTPAVAGQVVTPTAAQTPSPVPSRVQSPTPAPNATQRLAQTRALVQGAPRTRENVRRDLLNRLNDIEKRVAARKFGDARDKIQDVIERTTTATRRGELDTAVGQQAIVQLQALAAQLG